MSAVLVLTPLIIGSWPAIAAAAAGVAAAMGFGVATGEITRTRQSGEICVETEVPESEVLQESLGGGDSIVLQKEGVTVEIRRDERGACTAYVTGKGQSKAELGKIGEEVTGRLVQQFTYNKIMTELKKHNFILEEEQVMEDESIQMRVRRIG